MRLSLILGLVMVATFVVAGVAGPWLAPYDPTALDLAGRFQPASAAHWLGTDQSGADALSQLLWGARRALEVSVIVVAISATVGVTLGALAGYLGGWIDDLVMRLVDVLIAFPGILLNLAIVATVARPGLGVMIGALCANGWVGYARVARGQGLGLRGRDFVTAAVALGASRGRVLLRHVIPNLMGPVIVQVTFGLAAVILVEAALSFLGLGPQLDYTWGAMLSQGTTFLWKPGFVGYALAPGLAITWVVLGANLLGDGLRDRLDRAGAARAAGPTGPTGPIRQVR
jgi:peptide/nickel transport system permease protein